MHYPSLPALISDSKTVLSKGPIALILLKDEVEVDSTIRHHLEIGFHTVIVFCVPDMQLDADLEARVHRVDFEMLDDNALTTIVNTVAGAAPGVWFYYCYNSEYLFYPFCESRTIGEMIAFNVEERRSAILTYVIDLYAGDLSAHPNAVSHDDAHFDRSGYYALTRIDADSNTVERQLDFYGGLRWRFEEHVPFTHRRIDRISIFKAKPGLKLNADHTFNDAEYNTYSCPWHHSLTATVCSFRTAKALRRNPGSRFQIDSFLWRSSCRFEWNSKQLLELGLMEPGQWF